MSLEEQVARHFEKKLKWSDIKQLVREALEAETSHNIINEKLNQGDVVEGIFALAVGLYLFEGRIDAGALNNLRKQVDPSTWAGESAQKIEIGQKTGENGDIVKVVCSIRLKSEKSAGMAYGKDWEAGQVTVKDVPIIMNKQAHLLRDITKTHFLREIVEWQERILTDGKKDRILFTVEADGKAGETSKGELKGDVMLKVQASEITEDDLEGEFGKGIDGKELPFSTTKAFSLKSDNITVANRSPFVGMIEAAQWFGVLSEFTGCGKLPEPVGINSIPMDCAQKYNKIRQHTSKNPNKENLAATREEKYKTALAMWGDLKKLLVKLEGPEHKQQIFNYIIKAAFGQDADNIIDMSSSGIKEIRRADMEALMNDPDLNILPVDSGNYLKFYRKPKDGSKPSGNDLLYQFRVKISYGKKARKATENNPEGEYLEIKFYPEVGKLAYSEKDEEWYCKKYPSADGCETIG